MPIVHKSAVKRARQSEKRHKRNGAILHSTKSMVKKVKKAIQKKDIDTAQSLLKEATSSLHRAATKGVLKRNTASRRVSRLTLSVNTLKRQ